MEVVRNHRGVALAVGVVGLAHSIVFPGIAHAGFFDFLFGPPPQTRTVRPYEAYPGMPAYWGADPDFRRHADRGFRKHFHKHEHKFAARQSLIDSGDEDRPVRPLGATDIMDDDSLRKGDAVMTPAGIRIFAGHSGDRHEPEDFRKLSEIKGLSMVERKALAALDAQGHGIDGKPGLATGRSASELKRVPGETITDSQGRAIRYVGP